MAAEELLERRRGAALRLPHERALTVLGGHGQLSRSAAPALEDTSIYGYTDVGGPLNERRLELFDAPNFAIVTTLRADGSPESTVVWVERDGGTVSSTPRTAARNRGTSSATRASPSS